ncbi:MAG: hypothetical protein K0U41_08670, partial [Gammaproteobacteria bacterium]|nr:hypothetical protein [Gammaproteobacteria bacterium]
MNWNYNGTDFTEAPDNAEGFVYLMENNVTGLKYIGKKNFYSHFKRPPLKGYKRK